ncbi:MAG: ribosome small subunit-dependent GTPase A [Candidatus Moranbacteria bacterium]|nr:ribosome small subunit-dependent GTPase A [Candidatus Moranbacteria bacterium]
MTLGTLGYDDFFEAGRAEAGLAEFAVGRVLSGSRGAYRVSDGDREYRATVPGRVAYRAASLSDFPAVGDFVAFQEAGEGKAVVRGILPRKSVIRRRKGDRTSGRTEEQVIAANVDMAFVVESFGRDYSLNRLERYAAIARDGGVSVSAILNKADLVPEEELCAAIREIGERFPGMAVFATSVRSGVGIPELRAALIPGRTYALLGSSGVGKSSLTAILTGADDIRVGEIGERSERGRHVTTSRETYVLSNGAILIDNPGIREVGLADASEGVRESFEDVEAYAKDCRFADCTHVHEPGCAVLAALESGLLDRERYENRVALGKEAEFAASTAADRRKKDRDFGKFMKTAKEDLRRYKDGFSE